MHHCRMLLRLTVVGSLLITLSPVASAQSDPALLPTPLISALMAGDQYGSSRSGRFFVEATPTGWPADLVPASPATVLGGMSTGSQLISVFADTTKRFLANYLKSLADAGWSQPVIDRGGGFQSTGFAGSTDYFCRDSSRVSAIAVPGALTGALIHVTYQRTDPNACVNFNAYRSPAPASLLTLPPLPQPKGMQSSRTGSSSSGNEFSARTRLTGGALGTAAVLTHYTCLLVAAGWTTTPPAAADSIAAQGLRARDKDGKTWTGWLVVSLEGSTRDVSLSMRRSESQ